MTITRELTFPVRYVETDAMGVVHHSNYIIWFEAGRVECMHRAGVDYASVERSGVALAVAEVHARYLWPARFGDTVTVRVTLSEARSRAVRFDYAVVDASSGQLLVEGYTRHVPVDREGRLTRVPAAILAHLQSEIRAGA